MTPQKIVPMTEIICSHCGKKKMKKASQVRAALKAYKRIFCDRICWGASLVVTDAARIEATKARHRKKALENYHRKKSLGLIKPCKPTRIIITESPIQQNNFLPVSTHNFL